MDSVYSKVVQKMSEILKTFNSDPGVLSPITSSSSQHSEVNDNNLEYYVHVDPEGKSNPDISSMFNSNFWADGGDKMTEKTLDVNTSETTQNSYTNPGSATTEPDSQSQIAIAKAAEMKPTTVGTTANTTQEAPSKGETTEPVEKAADCKDCGKAMSLCECSGMSKAEGDKCSSCGQAMPMKKADEPEPAAEAAKETPADEKKEEMKKSLWDGSFSPLIKRG